MRNVKVKIIADTLKWFDFQPALGIYPLVYERNTNTKADQAFCVICQIFTNENVLNFGNYSPEDIVKYFNAFKVDDIEVALINHKRYMRNAIHYPFLFNKILNNAHKYNQE